MFSHYGVFFAVGAIWTKGLDDGRKSRGVLSVSCINPHSQTSYFVMVVEKWLYSTKCVCEATTLEADVQRQAGHARRRARRVGKSTLAEKFASNEYAGHLVLDCSHVSEDISERRRKLNNR